MNQGGRMPASEGTQTPAPRKLQGTVIAEQLEAEIVSGDLTAGSKLDELSLVQRFGVSRTPIREALHKLVAMSLAERMPFRGVVVANITRERIEQMFEAMGEIEAMCGRLAADRMTIGERAEIEDLHRAMGQMAQRGEFEAYEAANTEFHQRIYDATHNRDLIELSNALRLKLAPFRKSQLRNDVRMEVSNEEHEAIVSALLDHDPKRTENALRRHLVSAAREVLTRMR
ncbi:MAG: GntR family transcriptional regulator [Rhodobacteraceae bacterium]|jgi:Transcriptional regulators|nr:MAG: GntR family transcriptional regulator [Paracoccaceae bacterium]